MKTTLSVLFHCLRRKTPSAHQDHSRTDLHSVRNALLQAVEDCSGLPAQQLQLKIRCARSHRDLWMLRSDAYHLISISHCQTIADQRIRELMHLFEGWVAPKELSRTP